MNYVFEEQGKKYHSLGLTHQKKTFGKKNMPLSQNPQKNAKGKSYIRNGIITDNKRSYSQKTYKNFSFANADKPKITSKIRYYKSRRK